VNHSQNQSGFLKKGLEMNIWFDLSNSPHINMFRAMIAQLREKHNVVVTCRPLANTIDLLEMHKIDYTVVGTHYGKSTLRKAYGYPVRIFQLVTFLRRLNIDVAVAQSSFHSPVVARFIGARSIYLNDNEHAIGNVPAFAFATRIMVPEFLTMENLIRQGAKLHKVKKYPGVKEGIYLWQRYQNLKPNIGNSTYSRRRVYIRPEPWTAQYYKGERNFLDDAILQMQSNVEIIVLPRTSEQYKHYSHQKFSEIKVQRNVLDVDEIAANCDLFIGAGGTMTREMAVLGIPTVSVYKDELLDVDRYLLSERAFVHKPDLKAPEALEFLDRTANRSPNSKLLDKGRAAYEMILDEVTHEI
jgi:predicted glycosyltransferase